MYVATEIKYIISVKSKGIPRQAEVALGGSG